MATFIISYDAHNVRDYDTLYEEFADADDDSVMVIQVKPKPIWATRLVTKEASDWLKANL